MEQIDKNNKTSIQRNMLYNTVGSLIYYACQWLMSVVIVRISGYEAAGLLSLAMSVTTAPALVALFNVRSYQVSDIDNEYSTNAYIRSRTFSNVLAFAICLVMVFAGGYSVKKAVAIIVFMVLKVIEGYADVYYGVEQKHGRLDYSGISMTMRGIGIIVPFVLALYLWNNVIAALGLVSFVNAVILVLWDVRIVRRWGDKAIEESKEQVRAEVKRLLITCYPLAIVAFMNALSVNISKMALEQYYGTEIMGYYSSVASPTLVVQLAATTVFAPLMTPLTEAFQNKDKKRFGNICKRFSILAFGLTAICLVGSKLLAHWGLTLLFGNGIEPYVYLFVPAVIISVLLAVNAIFYSMCTLMREIKKQYMIGIAAIIVAFVVSLTLVKPYGMDGLIWAQYATLATQIVIQIAIMGRKLKCYW